MQNLKIIKTVIFISGLTAAGIGLALLFFPVAFQSTSGIILGDNVNLLSETRAPGGLLFSSGLLILLGTFIPRLTFTAIVLSTLIYLSYGISRIFSMVIDGIPSESLVIATVLEIIIGLAAVYALLKYRPEGQKSGDARNALTATLPNP